MKILARLAAATLVAAALAGCGGSSAPTEPVSASSDAGPAPAVCPEDGTCAPFVDLKQALCPDDGLCAPFVVPPVPAEAAVCPLDGDCAPFLPEAAYLPG